MPFNCSVPDHGRVFRQHGRQGLLDRGNHHLVAAHQAGFALHLDGTVANRAWQCDLQGDQALPRRGAVLPFGGRVSSGIKASPAKVEIMPGWHCLGFSTTSVERSSGQHAKHLLAVVEESFGRG